jgi:thermitase
MRTQGRQSVLASLVLISLFLSFNAVAAFEPEAVPGEYVVKLKDKSRFLQFGAFDADLQGVVKNLASSDYLVLVQRSKIELRDTALAALNQAGDVLIAEPNFIYRKLAQPNDPDYSKLWGLKNVGQSDGRQTGVQGVDINVEKAWDLTTGSQEVVVAVIDTGVDYNHPDLKANAWINQVEANGQMGVDDDGNGFTDDIYGYDFSTELGDNNPLDDHGHGSHCAGTIGGKGDDGFGIVGVNWNVKLMGVKFLSSEGSGTLAGAIKSIDYAVKMKAQVLSASWGGGGQSEILKEAIQRANEAGALFVAAAGNSTSNNDIIPTYPASYNVPNVLSVAAVDNRGQLATFSNFGKRTVHVAAPGVNVLSSVIDGKYDTWSGTSMATPHVSGVAALMLAMDPSLSNTEIKKRIISTAKPLVSLKTKIISGGVVDAFAAVTNTVPAPDVNDPANWPSVERTVSTPHPYSSKSSYTYEVQVDGAKEIAIYFSKFQTEKNYDYVSFYDQAGNLLGQMHGDNEESFSPVFATNYVKIVLTSDDSIQGYGFDITRVAFR